MLAGFTFPGSASAMRASLTRRVLASPTYTGLRLRQADLVQVRRSLASAWGAETLLALAGKYASEDALTRLANNWGVAQLYYVVYHATQALFVASGNPRPDSHPATQRIFENVWAERVVQLPPWSFAAGDSNFQNGPPNRVIAEGIHAWVRCTPESCWDIAAKALRTTREDALPEAVRRQREQKRRNALAAWRANERDRVARGRLPRREPKLPLPRLTAEERGQVAANLRAYTLMDYLWRLRIKTNYEDATMFTDGPQEALSSSAVHRDLVSLAEATLLVIELHVRQLIGVTALRRLVEGWISTNVPAGAPLGLALRRGFLLP